MSANEASTQETFKYDEEWEVWVGNSKEPYILDEKEYAVLSDSILKGFRGAVQFEGKLINIPYVQSAFRRRHVLKEQFRLQQPPEEPERELTPEEREQQKKRIEEIKKQLRIKFGVDKKEGNG